MLRSTSSERFKTDIEDIEPEYSSKIYEMRPVFYRSLSSADNPDHGYWGLIAEEVAEIDPRLVQWGYLEEDYEEVEMQDSEGETVIIKKLKDDAVRRPLGVQYDRLSVLLLKELQIMKTDIQAALLSQV